MYFAVQAVLKVDLMTLCLTAITTVGYRIKLIMPADQSEERKSAMAAFGAELISVPSSSNGGGMEAARDLAARMQVSCSPA